MNKDSEDRKLEIEERRFTEEIRLKNKELELREREIVLQEKQVEATQKGKGVWSQVFSPVGVAVIVGLLGLIGTAVSGLINAKTERDKQQASQLLEKQKQEANLILKMTDIPDEKQRALNLLFYAQGGYLHFSDDYTTYLRDRAGLKQGEKVPPPSITPTTLVEIPTNLNQGLTQAKHETLVEIFGPPCDPSRECSPVSNPKLKGLMVRKNVGPFFVFGIRPAVDALERIFAEIKQQKPDLYKQIQNGGMLCCKSARNVQSRFNEHSWGTAIDLQISGQFDASGDKKTQSGLLELYPFFNKEKFFWGAESEKSEQSFHFEASAELIMEWQQAGMLSDE